jgi:hypothetical protein
LILLNYTTTPNITSRHTDKQVAVFSTISYREALRDQIPSMLEAMVSASASRLRCSRSCTMLRVSIPQRRAGARSDQASHTQRDDDKGLACLTRALTSSSLGLSRLCAFARGACISVAGGIAARPVSAPVAAAASAAPGDAAQPSLAPSLSPVAARSANMGATGEALWSRGALAGTVEGDAGAGEIGDGVRGRLALLLP